MFLAYMDESGNTGAKADTSQPIHMLGCLLVEDVAVRPLEDAIASVAAKHFPEICSQANFEFHGAELYSGKGLFKKIKPPQRIAAMRELLQVTAEHAAAFGYTGVNKSKSYANDHPHRIAFTLMVEKLDPWLRTRSALGLIVADENNEIGQNLITDMEWFKKHSTSWGYVNVKVQNIIDSVHFVKSHNNRLIQACDVITYMTLKIYHLRKRKLAEYFALDNYNDLDFYEWRAANCTRAEAASLELGEVINQISSFRAKVWPQ